ncbi:hypothetical protein H6G80_00600 [Nostoc sp. FACHB-87]|nr:MULTISPECIES: hypothetical protein [Nostocales]MBD2297563.1 hypothetical protein [Nostoc sp. FACHB-190]MBD2452601.1 hypothetical protein [Nostoc sp. FACHB-87]MBD2486197.1 hypothetical protein [Aulosira sp. FACHB-615]
MYTVPIWQHSRKAINSLLNLDRSTLGKCRYTSLELVGRSLALIADLQIDKLVKVANHNQNTRAVPIDFGSVKL